MESVNNVADYLVNVYEQCSESKLDSELKLQKLVYLCQRESFALTGEKLFEENIEGWRHGPVIPELRFYDFNFIPSFESIKISEKAEYIIKSVVSKYAHYSAWYLRNLSHEEYSWKQSRVNLDEEEAGSTVLKDENIFEDAKKVRIYDHQYDMYLDEFEDLDEEKAILGF